MNTKQRAYSTLVNTFSQRKKSAKYSRTGLTQLRLPEMVLF